MSHVKDTLTQWQETASYWTRHHETIRTMFAPLTRALIEDDSVHSEPTTLINLEGGYQLFKRARVNLQLYNVFDAKVSDIDYYFTSRLPGEPLEGVNDIHFHPAVPRTARVSLVLGF